MNKKFLSVALFGALLVASAGTFTSCKDYDDDINGLSSRVDAVEKSLAELNTKFGSLAYVKSVSFADGKLVVTDQSGTPSTFTIPDMNTTYTLTVNQKEGENKATITLTPSSGNAQSITVSFTDTNTPDTTLDPSLFFVHTDGFVWYGDKKDITKCKKTGIEMPAEHKASIAVQTIKDGKTIGWDIIVDGTSVRLNIQDVLPITGFTWIPKVYYNGIEAVEFPTLSYNIVKAGASADTTYVGSTPTLSSFPGVAYFHVNPSSATLAQIATGDGAVKVLYKGAVNHTTRSAEINAGIEKIDIKDGELSATISADLNKAETAADKLDMLAVQLTTTAGNTFTTSYFAVYNKKEAVSFAVVDKDAFAKVEPLVNHTFVSKWSTVKAQAATIDADNMPVVATNSHLVQAIEYDEAIAGIDLNTLFKVAKTSGNVSEDFDWANNNLSVDYTLCKYDVNSTDQINYAKLNGSKLTAVNYNDVNLSCIGKTPIVKITVKDVNNNNAVVAVSYIKLLYVAKKLDVCANWDAPVNTFTTDWKCFVEGDLDFTSTVEYMSTKVYPNIGSELGLNALSKEEFAANYTYVATANVPTDLQGSDLFTSIEEVQGADNNADNRQIKFNVNDEDVKNKKGNATYTFYGVYKKNTAAAAVSSKYFQYPEYVRIPYAVTVQNYPTPATIKKIDDFRIAQAWENGFAICKGSKQTDNGAALYLNLTEAIDLTEFAVDYAGYSLEIVNPASPAVRVAEFGNQWCGSHGDRNWVVLTKQLTNEEEIVVPVKVFAVLCNGDKIEAGTVNVKFMNPAKITLSKTVVNVKDGLVAYNTKDLKKYITIKSSKDNSDLYKDGALTTLGQKILGTAANVKITLTKGTVTPVQWENKFTLNADGTVTWNLEGQNTLAKGQNATCEVSYTIEYGKVVADDVLPGCTNGVRIGGSKLTGKFTIKAWNSEEFTAE